MEAKRRTLGIVLVNVALYALAFQLQRPIEPFLVKKLGADDREYGKLQSFFSVFQSLGSPLVGMALDAVGARVMFVVVFAASATSYAILANATTIGILYLSKVPSVLQAGFLVAQALIASSTQGSTAERAAALGRLTTAYTVGATLGPAAGGFFGANGDYYLGAKCAVMASLFSAALALLLPRNIGKGGGEEKNIILKKGEEETSTSSSSSKNKEAKESSPPATTKRGRSKRTVDILRRVWPWLAAKASTGVTNSALGAAIPLVLRDRGFDEQKLGFGMSATAIVVAVVGAFFVGPLSSAAGANLPALALATKAMAVFAIALATGIAGDYAALICAGAVAAHAAVSHVLATSLTTATTGLVQPNEQGSLLGIEHGLFAAARIFGPTLGTTGLARFGIVSVALLCAASDTLLALAFPTTVRWARPTASSKKPLAANENYPLTSGRADEKKNL